MIMSRLFNYCGYKIQDIQISTRDQQVSVYLTRKSRKSFICYRCKSPMERRRGHYLMQLQELPIMNFRTIVKLWREKGHCPQCNKARSEHIEFVADETPHFTHRYAWWIGEMCEFAAVKRVADFTKFDNMTVRRIDFARIKQMLKHYKIPSIKKISVDEVYAVRHKGRSRSESFFTVVSDIESKKVIWVSEGRSKEALDQFFELIGTKACKEIVVVATDQFDGYGASAKQYCKNATLVWDRFHLMKNFNDAVNETRRELHAKAGKGDPILQLARPKYKYIFLQKDSRRSSRDKRHIEEVFRQNGQFLQLDLIKESMLTFFDAENETIAKERLDEITMWAYQARFEPIKKCLEQLHKGWETLKNYFKFRVSTGLSEGINNVIKALKRRAFGYQNKEYFRYKIMQVCGYLNSRYINNLQKLAR